MDYHGLVRAVCTPFTPIDYNPDAPPLMGSTIVFASLALCYLNQLPYLLLYGRHQLRPLSLGYRRLTHPLVSPSPHSPSHSPEQLSP